MEPTTQATKEQQPKNAKQVNQLARTAAIVAVVAEVMFVVAAIVPQGLSMFFGLGSGVVALAGFVMGLISLKNRPRNLSVVAIVMSGVILLIFAMVIVGMALLTNLK